MQLYYVLLYPHWWIDDDTPGRLIMVTDSKVEALKRLVHEIIQGVPQKNIQIITCTPLAKSQRVSWVRQWTTTIRCFDATHFGDSLFTQMN